MHHSTLGPIHLMVGRAALLLSQLVLSHGSYILIQSSAIKLRNSIFKEGTGNGLLFVVCLAER